MKAATAAADHEPTAAGLLVTAPKPNRPGIPDGGRYKGCVLISVESGGHTDIIARSPPLHEIDHRLLDPWSLQKTERTQSLAFDRTSLCNPSSLPGSWTFGDARAAFRLLCHMHLLAQARALSALARMDSLTSGWQMNIFGGLALTRDQFASFIPQTFSSFHLLVATPLGTYHANSPINPSANRWMVSPTVNFSYTPDEGRTWVETYVTGQFFSGNDNYLVNGAQTLSQKRIFRLEEHVSRNLTDSLWLSADTHYNVGGDTKIDGVGQDNMANTLRVGAGMGLRLWRGADLGLNNELVVAKPVREPDSQTVRFSLRQLW